MDLSEDVIQAVWEHARGVMGHDPTMWRKDECGAWIKRSQYANTSSEFGWVVDRRGPSNAGDPSSLRAVHWRNSTSGSRAIFCMVKAVAGGVRNSEAR